MAIDDIDQTRGFVKRSITGSVQSVDLNLMSAPSREAFERAAREGGDCSLKMADLEKLDPARFMILSPRIPGAEGRINVLAERVSKGRAARAGQ